MDKRIIYLNDENNLAIIIPSSESGLSTEEIAKKDVPENVPYKIIDVSEIPIDRTFRSAWEADFSNPDGYGIGHDAWFNNKK